MSPSDRKWLRSPSERVGTLAHADLPPPRRAPRTEERGLLRALRERDEAAFAWLLDRYYTPMLRVARRYVRSPEEAEEAVQDAWLGVLAGLDRFQGRSSLKTWIFRILVNRARTRAVRDARQTPFSALPAPPGWPSARSQEAVPGWLLAGAAAEGRSWHGSGWQPPDPEDELLGVELHARIEAAIAALPGRQQEVITLRDLEGCSPAEVCEILDLSEANQRVLLHRARRKVRDALMPYLSPADAVDPVPLSLAG